MFVSRVGCSLSYYYSRAQFSFANGDGELLRLYPQLQAESWILNYYWFLCFRNGNGELVSCTSCQGLRVLCIWPLFRYLRQWRVEKMVCNGCPGCRGRWKVYFILWFWGNGQWRMETCRRKNVECPLSEGLKHNERSSALQIMAVKPVMLEGR